MRKIVSLIAICITAVLVIALCGCDDLGEYEDVEEYYKSFGEIALIDGTSGETETYSMKEKFYNEESRENFLVDENGRYNGVEHSDYAYIAIPFKTTLDMDSLALYIQSTGNAAVYIDAYVIGEDQWEKIVDSEKEKAEAEENETPDPAPEEGNTEDSAEPDPVTNEGDLSDTQTPDSDTDQGEAEEPVYPLPETRICSVAVHLSSGNWGSFVMDVFTVNGETQRSIQIDEGQYLLLRIRNNSDVGVLDETQQIYIDPETGLELQRADITVTNLLIRSLKMKDENEAQGGD